MTEEHAEPQLLLLIDPAQDPEQEPPWESVLGAWPVDADGVRGRFQPNPIYQPSVPDGPLDPVDAVLRAMLSDDEAVQELKPALRDVLLSIAVDETSTALVRPGPDGGAVVLVATAHGHRAHVESPAWLDVTVEELAKALPAGGVDVLINSGSPASLRLSADAIRDAAGE
ncbi:type VII secretion system-associated protein [Lentzea sp. NBRC 102530]|uniref:type VII secretion system-associated protein n=1 Tax=Lentzea sp. NBRC 102530 TaxID=3032201 RepID=UPI0024A5967F|nr:type VII secretion system-associated protein [Lentzea sp. NBRC 102530]GLY46804.1 hypothetical protein Lesp01_04600 [Lentzea sp. NBRC 102530]